MITTGETTADAPRPDFGSAEKAIPSAVELALPRISRSANKDHFSEVAGSFNPKNATLQDPDCIYQSVLQGK